MGCDMHLILTGPDAATDDPTAAPLSAAELEAALDDAEQLIEELEAKWSRFRPDSELSRLNRERTVRDLSPETYALVEDAVEAWRVTDARFDPTVLEALLAAGYDRTFDEVAARSPLSDEQRALAPAADLDEPRHPAPGPVGIELDPATREVRLPDGVLLDLGGIGKGRAADLVAAHLRGRGVAGVCVNLGGDVRVDGRTEHGGPWVVAVDDPFEEGRDLTGIALEAGAVATSTRTRRTWAHGAAPAHHLIDPATGRPAARGVAAVTVVARDAEWAEVLAKAAFVAGMVGGVELVADAGAEALLVADDGTQARTPGFAAFEVTLAPAGTADATDDGSPDPADESAPE